MGKLYLFDCFGVVFSEVSSLWLNKRLDEEQKKYARQEVFTRVDDGTISLDYAHGILAKMCGIEKSTVQKEWNELTWVLTDTLSVLEELKKRGTVALLSNADGNYLHQLFDTFGVNKYFHRLFVSSELRCIKPNREIYEKCLASFNEKFDEIYFVDDNPANLVEPAKMGIKTLQFTSAEKLRKDLGLSAGE